MVLENKISHKRDQGLGKDKNYVVTVEKEKHGEHPVEQNQQTTKEFQV